MISAFRTDHDGRVYGAAIAFLIAAAWVSLIVLGASPYAGYLSHRQHPGGTLSFGLLLAIFVPAWTLMTVAMMLPTSLPLVTLFRTMVRRRPQATALVALLITAYLGTWAVFGAVVYLFDRVVHEVIEHTPLLAAKPSYLAVGILLLAGLYQFTPLKDRCLQKCRSPLSFVAEHWRGGSERLDAMRLGFRHGLFCLGCCWTLMLLMFAVGGVNLGWMLGLGAVMAAEKSAPWGRLLVTPVGVALIVLAVVLALTTVGAPLGS
jgi:predicted metal-binding membrane protein